MRRLGEAECRDCGYVATPEAVTVPDKSGAEAPGLSEEVAQALERVLGRGPVRG